MSDIALQMNIKRKIYLSFGAIVLLVSFLSIFAIYNMISLSNQTQNLYNHPFMVTNATKTIEANFISMHRYMKDVVLAKNDEDIQVALKKINISETIINKEFDIIFEKFLGDKKRVKEVRDAFIGWKIIRDEVFLLMKNGKKDEAAYITKHKGAVHVEKLNMLVIGLINFAQKKANYFLANAIETKNNALYTIVGVTAIILLIITILMTLLLKAVVQFQKNEERQQRISIVQARLSQMGELLSMIAHQWLQPLSAIASVAITLKIKLEMGNYNLAQRESLGSYIDDIDMYVKDLKMTLDDFRSFYKPNKMHTLVSINQPISKSLSIIKPSLEYDGIEVVENYHTEIELNLYENECVQVILNILKNAQDHFNERKIKNPKITITTKNDENKTSIEICDNGGGIADDIIEKIFDPYFSTKDEKNGTGLGLYMSKIIIEEHLKGKIYVSNRTGGACFMLELESKKLPF